MKINQKSILPIWFLFFSMSLTLLLLLMPGNKSAEDDYDGSLYGWSVFHNGRHLASDEISDIKLKNLKRGDRLDVIRILPAKIIPNPMLELYVGHASVAVSVDDTLIYEAGQELYEERKPIPWGTHYIPLDKEYSMHDIRVTYICNYDNPFTSLYTPRIVNGATAQANYIRANRNSLVVDLFLIVFGLLLLTPSLIHYLFSRKGFELFCIGMSSLLIGLWALSSSSLLVIFTDNYIIRSYTELVSLYMGSLFLFWCFRGIIMHSKDRLCRIMYRIIESLHISVTISAFILHYLNIIPLYSFLIFEQLLIICMIICLFIFFIRSPKNITDRPILSTGFLFVIMGAVSDLVMYNITKYFHLSYDGFFSCTSNAATMILVIAFILEYVINEINIIYTQAESTVYERMALTDELTGLNNRRHCEDVFDRMDDTGSDYAVLSLDLNNLKLVNDTYGHDAGDEYIRTFADILVRTFPSESHICRMGGDEFTIVIPGAANMRIPPLIKKMNLAIDAANMAHPNWNLSTACGVSTKSDDHPRNIREAYKLADSRMYENKIFIKNSPARIVY